VTNRRLLVFLVLGLMALSLAAALLARHEGAPGSALSATAHGWLAARRYAEARGTRVTLMDREDYPLDNRQTLWVVFPWQHLTWQESARCAREHLRRGGTLIVAYSGQGVTPDEADFFTDLGVTHQVRPETPLFHPTRWREQQRAEWRLIPAHEERLAASGRIRHTQWLPTWPATTEPLFRNDEGETVVGRLAHRGG
jgi:hypothetical protein